MLWKVKTEEGDIDLTAFEVINLLTAKIVDKERPDQENLSYSFAEYLQSNQVLANISLTQLIAMAFELGYFYRVFREKNNVKYEEVTGETSTDQSDPAPSS